MKEKNSYLFIHPKKEEEKKKDVNGFKEVYRLYMKERGLLCYTVYLQVI